MIAQHPEVELGGLLAQAIALAVVQRRETPTPSPYGA